MIRPTFRQRFSCFFIRIGYRKGRYQQHQVHTLHHQRKKGREKKGEYFFPQKITVYEVPFTRLYNHGDKKYGIFHFMQRHYKCFNEYCFSSFSAVVGTGRKYYSMKASLIEEIRNNKQKAPSAMYEYPYFNNPNDIVSQDNISGEMMLKRSEDLPSINEEKRLENIEKSEIPELDDDPEPLEPGESECCGNGCDDCVWVEYWVKSEAWRKRQQLKNEIEQGKIT